MNQFFEAYAHWLADYYLLSCVLLAFTLAALFTLRQPAKRRAVTQSTLVALFALALLCALPGWSLVHLITAQQLPQHPDESSVSHVSTEYQVPSTSPTPTDDLQIEPPASIASHPSTPASASNWPAIPWKTAFALAHTLGAICVVVWLALGSIAARRLRRGANAAPAELTALMQEVANATECSGSQVELLTSPRIDVPVALGILRPAVLLPTRWLENQSRDELRTVLAHEAAHVRNRDLHWLAVSRGLMILLWAQPLFWLVRRRLRLDQEALADAAAADLTSRQRYAEQLVAWARDVMARTPLRLSSAVGLWEGPSQLSRRIALLLNEHFTVLRACSRRWRIVCTSLIIATVTALSTFTLQPATRADEQEQTDQKASQASPPETRHSVQPTATATVFRAGALPTPPTYKKNALAVQVMDHAGKPVAGAEVSIFRARLQTGDYELVKKLSTDDRGEAEFLDLVAPSQLAEYEKTTADSKLRRPSDPFFIVAVKRPGSATLMVSAHEFNVATYGEQKRMRMRPAAELRGRVADPQGQPVSGALVAAGGWGGSFAIEGINTVRTDAHGRFVFQDRPVFDAQAARARMKQWYNVATAADPGERAKSDSNDAAEDLAASDLVVAHPDFAMTRVQGGDIPGNIDVQLAPAASIAGRVLHFGSGKPASGVPIKAVALLRRQGSPESSDTDAEMTSVHTAATQTDERGQYRLDSLPAGDYDVWVQPGATDWKDIEWVSSGIRGVRAKPDRDPAAAPDLVIGPGGKIRGQLIDADTSKPIRADADGPFVRPYVQFVDGPQLQDTIMQTVPVALDGTFEIRTPPGKVRAALFVYLHKTADLGQPDYQSDDDFHRSGPILEVRHGQTIDAEFVVRPMAQLEEIRSQLKTAHELVAQGKLDDAIATFTEVLQKYPANTSSLTGRALALAKAGRFVEAVADFETRLKLSPNDTAVKLYLTDFLATSPVAGIRDGRRAPQLATEVATGAEKSQLDSNALSWALSIVAAAHAELGEFDKAIAVQKESIKMAPEHRLVEMRNRLELYQNKKPFRRGAAKESAANEKHGPVNIRLVQHSEASNPKAPKSRPPALLSYGDGKPDGKKSYGGSGHFIRFELPEGVTKVRGIRIHCSRYGYPQAPDEDAEITFLSEDRDETLHTEAAPYRMFKRGKENWVRVMFDKEIELPKRFWIALNFNAEQTKGVYVSYDTSTKGEHSRVGLPGDEEEPKETDFAGDWMVQVMLARPKK